MNLGLTINCWSDEDLLFANQFGVTHILAEANIRLGVMWNRQTLAAMRNRVERAGFTFTGLAGLPQQFDIASYLQLAQSNDPAADESLLALCTFLTEAGVAHIPLIVCDCDAPRAGEAMIAPEGRGGALVHKYEQLRSTEADSSTLLWEHLTHWLQRVVPAAEKAGVKLAFGVTSASSAWLGSIEALQRLLDIVPSSCVGLNFRQGVLTQALGSDILVAIRHFCVQKKIFLVEVGNLRSDPPHKVEAFLDEPIPEIMADDAVMLSMLRAYHAAGYTGAVYPAAPLGLVGDTAWGHKGQAFNLGYLRSLLQVLERA